MEFNIKMNAVNSDKSSVRAFAQVVFGDSFKITNVAVVENREHELFVTMPSYRSKERDERNNPVFKDICNPITKEFREELYGRILNLYDEMVQSGKKEITDAPEEKREVEMPKFSVNVTPLDKSDSNTLGLARIYFEDSFVVGNVSILEGKETGKKFVSMPSHRVSQKDKDGKPMYQDVCFPVTAAFREKLYNEILSVYAQEKEKKTEQSMAYAQQREGRMQRTEATPFR